ncbi:MAG: glutamate racemase [Amoebophilaceae bacterium]|nr:glutamate racemase [Amoebophilaceae bacterium]
MSKVAPIAIYDSGVGGLVVAKAIQAVLPQELIHYIGDTEHLPYGEKTAHQLKDYCTRVVNFCLDKKYKLLVIACNTATAVLDSFACAYLTKLHQALGIVNVVDPLVNHIITRQPYRRIGLIGTTYTVASGRYEQRLEGSGIKLFSLATPELASMVEASFAGKKIDYGLVDYYLNQLCGHPIEVIVPACTHYLFLKQPLQQLLEQRPQHNIAIMDVERVTALAVKDFLTTHDLINDREKKGVDCFMATKLTPAFEAATQQLFGDKPIAINLDRYSSYRAANRREGLFTSFY